MYAILEIIYLNFVRIVLRVLALAHTYELINNYSID